MNTVRSATLSLVELQQKFQSAVLNRRQTPPTFIDDTANASSSTRFNVYTEAYRLRLIEALSSDYPALKDYLGDKVFDIMARAYIDATPSDNSSIRWFGHHLSRFLSETPPYAKQSGLKELASFEWALGEAFDASENTLISYQQLAAIQPSYWPLLRLGFHPSMRRLDMDYNAPQLWQASNQQESLPEFEINTEMQSWIVWRRELKLLFRSLSIQEAFSLDTFMQGKSFAEVCEGLCEWLDEEQVAMNAAGFLQAWVRDGWIVEVAISKNGSI